MNITQYYKMLHSGTLQYNKHEIIQIIQINHIIHAYNYQFTLSRKHKTKIESLIQILHQYSDDEIIDVFSHLMTLNNNIKILSNKIYNLVTERNNIINKTNKSVSRKKPTSASLTLCYENRIKNIKLYF